MKITHALILLTAIACTQKAQVATAPTPAAPTTPVLTPPTATEIFNLRSRCAALGQEIMDNNAIGSALTQSQVSHYDPNTNRCYVELDVHMADLRRFNEYNSSTVFDGQTREMLAHIDHRKDQQFDGAYVDIPYAGDVAAAARARIRELMSDDRKQ